MPAPKRDIYLLSSKELSPETIAVAFAKTSRFPDSFRDIAADLTGLKLLNKLYSLFLSEPFLNQLIPDIDKP